MGAESHRFEVAVWENLGIFWQWAARGRAIDVGVIGRPVLYTMGEDAR